MNIQAILTQTKNILLKLITKNLNFLILEQCKGVHWNRNGQDELDVRTQ